MQPIDIAIAGENSLLIQLSSTAEPAVANRIQRITGLLWDTMGEHIIDLIPSYGSILVLYNPLTTDHFAVKKMIWNAIDTSQFVDLDRSHSSNPIELPVYYGSDAAPDIESLAKRANLSVEQVIDLHQSIDYRVYAIGFAPGFAYLGDVDQRIAAPRLATPRKRVPKGAVAIADRQTAVYPSVSPGGWNLIGLCPTPMFEPDKTPSMPVKTGDKIRFKAIELNEFLALGGEIPHSETIK